MNEDANENPGPEGTQPGVGIDPAMLAEALTLGSAPPAAAAPGQAVAPLGRPVDYRAEARQLWKTIAMIRIRYSRVGKVLTPQVIEELADAWAPLLEQYQLDFGKWGPWIVVGCSTGPVLVELYEAVKLDRQEEQLQEAAAKGPGSAPGAIPGGGVGQGYPATPKPAPAAAADSPTGPLTPPDPHNLAARA